ncbi:MAG: DUF4157 domain-containing protein [Parvularculaceae bacterium]
MSGEMAGFRERPLTEQEKSLLPAPLANGVDLDAVRILNRWHNPVARLLKATVTRGAGIFWAGAPVEATSLGERAHLAHELVHVWQYVALGVSGAEIFAHRRYHYRFDLARAFRSYGYEQQAALVEDLVRLRAGAPARWAKGPIATNAQYASLVDKVQTFA